MLREFFSEVFERGGGWVRGLPVLMLTLLAFACPQAHAQRPWPLWAAYAQRFIDDQGRVIDRSANDRTTSEGQAYAMFFALVDNDRARFDKLLKWTEANLAAGNLSLRLPAWNWGHAPAGAWGVLDDNSASDADLWMAYDLLEAGRLWHEPRYAKLGTAIATQIVKQEVVTIPSVGTWLAPGPRGFHLMADTYVVNPSYMPLPLLQRFAHASPAGPWKLIAASLPTLLAPAVGNGFAMDWVSVSKTGVQATFPPVQGSSGQQSGQPAGSYDAIRVYLWAGITDPAAPGLRSLLPLLTGMKNVVDQSGVPPEQVSAAGKVVHADSPVGFSAAVIPYLNALGDKNAATQSTRRVTVSRDAKTGLVGTAVTYYDQNLVLFSTGYTEGRFRFRRDGQLAVSW